MFPTPLSQRLTISVQDLAVAVAAVPVQAL